MCVCEFRNCRTNASFVWIRAYLIEGSPVRFYVDIVRTPSPPARSVRLVPSRYCGYELRAADFFFWERKPIAVEEPSSYRILQRYREQTLAGLCVSLYSVVYKGLFLFSLAKSSIYCPQTIWFWRFRRRERNRWQIANVGPVHVPPGKGSRVWNCIVLARLRRLSLS